ncbi:MAG: hypothetical protein FJ396_03295 [Verrucomicrobia bacterium]|nr:hypothetical protein [Verrucomicrobiota bacterium]
MIALRDEFLLVAQEGGQFIPCSVEHLTFELAGAAAQQVDPEWMRQAAAGVLHYFKDELGKSHVTVAEFTAALSKVFQGLGLTAEVQSIEPAPAGPAATKPPLQPIEALATGETPPTPTHATLPVVWRGDLRAIAVDSVQLGELAFQQALLTQLATALEAGPQTVEFSGLRGCVKMITGRKIWCPECRRWSDWIVDLLRLWLSEKAADRQVALVVH